MQPIKLEAYFLPDGGKRGKDEIAVHSDFSSYSLNRQNTSATFSLFTWGQERKLDYSVFRPGDKGVFTLLYPKTSVAAIHFEVFAVGLDFAYPFDNRVETQAEFRVRGPIFDGAYAVDHQWGRVRIDQGDGTFLERPLTYTLPLDQLIQNRGWT